MFQSLKKWVKNEDIQQRPAPPQGMQFMKGDLQRKFAKGVHYNMKIVIRGDRNTGKTCLWHRLKGNKFIEEYLPTSEIQVASIQWDYKATDDIVKVDVWDVVDQGKKKELKGLKIADEPAKEALDQQVLDASFMDVYKHAHAVILIFDITKKWTFQYIERELTKVPSYIPVLILANFRDMGDHRVITIDEVEALVESVDRPPGSPSIMFYECSMKNGFGLRYIHKFFNMPFLLVQRESLLKQLETNHLDLESCMEELSTEEHGYDEFLRRMQNSGKKTSAPVNGTQQTDPSAKTPTEEERPQLNEKKVESPSVKESIPSQSGSKGDLFSPAQMEKPSPSPPAPEPEKRGFMSRFFRRSSNEPTAIKEQPNQKIEPTNKTQAKPVENVDEFVPDDGSVDDFLNEIPDSKERQVTNNGDSSDDGEDGGNPMVAGFQEDLDSDDDFGTSYKRTTYSTTDSDTDTPKHSKNPLPNVTASSTSKKEHAQLSQASRNIGKSTEPNMQDLTDSEEDLPRPEITQDADLSSDESPHTENISFTTIPKESDDTQHKQADYAKLYSVKSSNTSYNENQTKHTTLADSDTEDDTKVNAMVSSMYDDISSGEESTPQPPVAIVTPLQAERSLSFEDETDINPKLDSLNLELSLSDLNFLEQKTKQPDADATERSSKEGRSHRSKKSSSRRSEEDGASKKSHKKHKKHRTRDNEERDISKSEEGRSHRTKEDRERKKKRKSRDPVPSTKSDTNMDNDLEAFLSGM